MDTAGWRLASHSFFVWSFPELLLKVKYYDLFRPLVKFFVFLFKKKYRFIEWGSTSVTHKKIASKLSSGAPCEHGPFRGPFFFTKFRQKITIFCFDGQYTNKSHLGLKLSQGYLLKINYYFLPYYSPSVYV